MLLPPSNFPVFDLRSKKRKIYHASHGPSPCSAQPVIKHNSNLLREYIEFVNVRPAIREQVFQILDKEEITHPNFFVSQSIPPDRMLAWGLKDGVIAQLRDNVFNFEQHLALKKSA
jgi:hypothetical protein